MTPLLAVVLAAAGCAETTMAVADTSRTSATFVAHQDRFVARGPLTIDSATIVDGAASLVFYLQPGAATDLDCMGVSNAKVVVAPKERDMAFRVPEGQGACVTSTHNFPTNDTPATVAWQIEKP